jgi:hypothetical protein
MSEGKKGLNVSGGYSANRDGIGGGGRVEYVYKNGKVTAVPYVEGSAFKGRKGKPHTSVDRVGFDAEYKPSENTSIKGGVSAGQRGRNKEAGIEASYSFKKGGAVHTMPDGKKMKGAKHGMKHGGAVKGKKCRMDGIAVRGKTRAKQRSK